jgi:hypothetical protein
LEERNALIFKFVWISFRVIIFFKEDSIEDEEISFIDGEKEDEIFRLEIKEEH